ncbi:hypothetical protein [Collimonas humicola]|nr:hypothetical protein [Collimonas humicola]
MKMMAPEAPRGGGDDGGGQDFSIHEKRRGEKKPLESLQGAGTQSR